MKKIIWGLIGALAVVNAAFGLFAVGRYLMNTPNTIAVVLGFNLFAITIIGGGILIAHAIRIMHVKPEIPVPQPIVTDPPSKGGKKK